MLKLLAKVVIFFDLMSNRFLLFYPFENFPNYRVNKNKTHKLSDIYCNSFLQLFVGMNHDI